MQASDLHRMNHPERETEPARTRSPAATWDERCASLFVEMKRPARAMVARAFGSILSEADVDDIYASAWASVLKALRHRGPEMDDAELRTYLLTAVATSARKELRRRGRRRADSLGDGADQWISSSHDPSPEELAIGAEEKAIARDVLMSMPKRRRAVLLLRYGGGLSPSEVCSRVDGLSARAYRKEVSKGIDAMIDGLEKVSTGQWCERQRQVLRDLASGIGDDSRRREAEMHVAHCRSCARARVELNTQLNELGSALALLGGAGAIGVPLSVGGKLTAAGDAFRESVASAVERVHEQMLGLAIAGGTRGAGTMGTGVVAKLVSAGAATKLAVACAGAGAAATACLASGLIPAVMPGSEPSRPKVDDHLERVADDVRYEGPFGDGGDDRGLAVDRAAALRKGDPKGRLDGGDRAAAKRPRTQRPGSSAPKKAREQAVAEFDPLAGARTTPPPSSPQPAPAYSADPAPSQVQPGSSSSPGGSADARPDQSVAREEFGP